MKLLLRSCLTLPVVGLLLWPALQPNAGGFFTETERLGVWGLVLAASFLTCVVLYCRELERLLVAIDPAARVASPRSVWLMMLVPFNFVEDFFIVENLARSLQAQWRSKPRLAAHGTGRALGLTWCALQIVSLAPSEMGLVAGALAVPPWLLHWAFVRRVRRDLVTAANGE
ncbi:MAG: hypothetical protein ABTQ32_06900 [Myxococcaceae bacterium]